MQQLGDIEKRIKHVEKRMEMLQKRLDVLELQIDAKGEIDVEPYRITERDKLRREISELKVERENLEAEKQELGIQQEEQPTSLSNPPLVGLVASQQPPSPASARSPNQQEKNMQHEATVSRTHQQAVSRTATNQVLDVALPLLGVIVVFALLIYSATVLPWAELLLISVALIIIMLAILTYVGLQSRAISEASWFKMYLELLRHISILGATLPTEDETKNTQPNQKSPS